MGYYSRVHHIRIYQSALTRPALTMYAKKAFLGTSSSSVSKEWNRTLGANNSVSACRCLSSGVVSFSALPGERNARSRKSMFSTTRISLPGSRWFRVGVSQRVLFVGDRRRWREAAGGALLGAVSACLGTSRVDDDGDRGFKVD